jgi:hypothetical protein
MICVIWLTEFEAKEDEWKIETPGISVAGGQRDAGDSDVVSKVRDKVKTLSGR